ncbi:LytTR family DNA-binding domain-containing protein [Pseudoduganella ginsengisoli]|uniref:Response regulator n=1 Tax=Pseudoduganella ginsengisoli TaxID=1462440 RepID=A0A6L6Q7Y3_9BURK|nr:LytTR family DNA-binding domain-containing protein [Pseudoduganella ginsengisoli]MTW05559.1 response regulator [Pseudoduganella ginsengisoli]
MTLQAIIAEDEAILAATLAHALSRLWPELHIAATCPHGVAAVEKTLALRPDVLFLDIKMPGKTGLEAAEELSELWEGDKPFPQIVFVTAYDDYAVQAFEREAADYVLKPVSDARLARTVERLKARLAVKAPRGGLEDLLGQMRALMPALPAAPERLSVVRAAVGNQVKMIPIGDVVYFEALDKYVNVVTHDGEALIRTSLKELLPQLDDKVFWQVHRGTIVNSTCVLSAVKDEAGKLALNMRGRSDKVRVSPLYAHLFRQM